MDVHPIKNCIFIGIDPYPCWWNHPLKKSHGSPFSRRCHRRRPAEAQQQVLSSLATQNACLHCGAISHRLVGVNAAVRLLAVEEVLAMWHEGWENQGKTLGKPWENQKLWEKWTNPWIYHRTMVVWCSSSMAILMALCDVFFSETME